MNGNYEYTYNSFFRPYLTGIWFSTNLNIREINRIGKVSVPRENLFIYVDFSSYWNTSACDLTLCKYLLAHTF